MPAANATAPLPNERTVQLSRLLDAPRSLVFRMWTDPQHMAKWWGPRSFDNPVCTMDVRPGGALLIHMRGPDGTLYPMSGTFIEVVEPERLVFKAVAEDNAGNALLEAHTVVTFEDEGGKTRLSVHATGVGIAAGAPQMLAGMQEGWSQSLDKLADLLAPMRM
jgi:uncharacterized protein YndB with AHSA1/START domain